LSFILRLVQILLPLFIGLFIAWLLAPFISYLEKKGLNRVLGIILVYVLIIVGIYLLLMFIFPLLLQQINELLLTLPLFLDGATNLANKILINFDEIKIIDIDVIKTDILTYLNQFITTLATRIPEVIASLVKRLISTLGLFAISLVLSFYLLFDFKIIKQKILNIWPSAIKKDVQEVFRAINTSLFAYLRGTVYASFLVFVFSVIALSLIGLKPAFLLALIVGITDLIPYIGPYIGAIPVVIIGFTVSVPVGVLTIIALFIIQVLENNLIQPLIMSKTMNLHPVSVIIGVLIFGYFFGLLGMILATPLVAIIKIITTFFNKKYHLFSN